MNRIELLHKRLEDPTHATRDLQGLSFAAPVHWGGCHATFVPLHYEPNYAYPLLVWLHGAGKNEQQLRSVMPGISVRNYVGVAPRAPQASGDDQTAPLTWRQTPEDILASECRVMECIEATMARFNIAAERIFLLGCDQGGTMALRIAMMYPGRFAGAVSIGGPFPRGNRPLARIRQTRQVQLLIAHARLSETYVEAAVCDDLRLLHSAGISITLRQYPTRDEITSRMLSDVDSWIMELVVGSGHDADESEHLIL